MKAQIVEILNLSKKLQSLRNKEDQKQEKENVISFLNKISSNELSLLKERFEASAPEKINKIRLLVSSLLLEKKNITSDDIETIKSQVAAGYKENILHSWKSYFSLFLPFLYRDKIDVQLKAIGEDVINKLQLTNLVKLKLVDFDGANNFGSDKSWLAIYNKNQPSQGSSLQLFIQFSGDHVDYGLYRHTTKKRESQQTVDISEFKYADMISFLENDKQKIIDDNFFVKYWKFSPGENAIHWDAMVKMDIAAIGWGNHIFSDKSLKQLHELLPKFTSKSIGIVKLFFDAKVGDRIIAFKGRNLIIGYGEIIQVALYSDQVLIPGSDFHNYHKVKWVQLDKPIKLQKMVAMDAFADVSKRANEFNDFISFDNEMTESADVPQTCIDIIRPLNQILYGPPGTGKTYTTINKALEIIGANTEGKTRGQIKDLFDAKLKEGQIVFTTFHQSMSYEDFIEGIKPIEPKIEGQPVTYKVVDGIFKKLCKSVSPFVVGEMIGSYTVVSFSSEILTLKKPNGSYVPFTFSLLYKLIDFLREKNIEIQDFDGNVKAEDVDKVKYPELELYLINGYNNIIPKILTKLNNYQQNKHKVVLIIDEINRGNVSQIFGELITLIEDDKRLGKEEALEVTLPYSKEKFGVPHNLYIIGTMNTADRSVEALDAALRRRFSFEEMPPQAALIAKEGKLKASNGMVGPVDLPLVLDLINKRIEKLLDKDHQIGHSYFITVANFTDLKAAFQNKIIPLLQEYFFGDFGKIGLVLGKDFFEPEDKTEENIFANFDDYETTEFSERTIYKIKDIMKMNQDDFNNSINTLLKK